MNKIFIIAIAIMTLVSCTQIPKKSDNNNCITLEGNPTTGFTWEYTIDNPIVQISEDIIYLGSKNVSGAPSRFEYTLKAIKPGKALIDFIYHRPWENEEPLRQQIYLVIVDESKNITIESLPIK